MIARVTHLCFCTVLLVQILSMAANVKGPGSRLKDWREHRRQKRFLIFQNSGVLKFVCGIVVRWEQPEDRQILMAINLQFQMNLVTSADQWWSKWNSRKLNQGFQRPSFEEPDTEDEIDESQMFLYEWFVQYLNLRGANGKQCLLKLICENAQIDYHAGLWSEILHRVLSPHKSLDESYIDAMEMGKHRVDCKKNFPEAVGCLVDDYIHIHHIYPHHTHIPHK